MRTISNRLILLRIYAPIFNSNGKIGLMENYYFIISQAKLSILICYFHLSKSISFHFSAIKSHFHFQYAGRRRHTKIVTKRDVDYIMSKYWLHTFINVICWFIFTFVNKFEFYDCSLWDDALVNPISIKFCNNHNSILAIKKNCKRRILVRKRCFRC